MIQINFTHENLKRLPKGLEFRVGKYCFMKEMSIESPAKLFQPFDAPSLIKVGAFTYSWSPFSEYLVSVGRYCSFADGIKFGLPVHHTHWLTTSNLPWSPDFWNDGFGDEGILKFKPYPPPHFGSFENALISIGNDVWIGQGVRIMPGVKISDGAVIGASAVVTKDVPSYAIVGGVPAKIIKYRFHADIIDELLKLRWWDLPPDVLNRVKLDAHPDDFINDIKCAFNEFKNGNDLSVYSAAQIQDFLT